MRPQQMRQTKLFLAHKVTPSRFYLFLLMAFLLLPCAAAADAALPLRCSPLALFFFYVCCCCVVSCSVVSRISVVAPFGGFFQNHVPALVVVLGQTSVIAAAPCHSSNQKQKTRQTRGFGAQRLFSIGVFLVMFVRFCLFFLCRATLRAAVVTCLRNTLRYRPWYERSS